MRMPLSQTKDLCQNMNGHLMVLQEPLTEQHCKEALKFIEKFVLDVIQ